MLAWRSGPWLTVGMMATTVVAGLLPTASAYVAKLLMDAVVEAIGAHGAPVVPRTPLDLPGPLPDPVLTPSQKIVAVAAIQFGVLAFNALSNALANTSRQMLQERVTRTIRVQIMEHANRLDLAFFEGSTSYDLLRQAREEAPMRPVSMINGAFGLVQTSITFGTMVALLAAINPLLTVAALLAPIPAFVSEFRYSTRGFNLMLWFSPIARRMEYLSSLVTTDTYAKEVKLFGVGGHFVNRYRMLADVYYDRQRRLTIGRNFKGAAWGLISTLVSSLIYLYIALRAVAGELTLGDLTLYTAAATSVQSSVHSLFTGVSGMYENNLYLERLYRLLATNATITRPADPRPMPTPLRGHVVFDDVSFSYPGSDHPALAGVSFEIPPGQTVAVVGRNGAGKSTLLKLLCRLYDPTGGRILLDGVDVRDLDPEELRQAIGGMFQDYVTYQATAGENIGLGDLAHLTDAERIAEAARRGGAVPLVEELPDRYDTPLGRWFDQGVNLSGGQWQKIALSRAFIRDSPILVLDEPTSALDAQAEHDLFARLRELALGRTALYISHRFSTVRQADRIVLLRDGRLVEDGSHEQLMRTGGEYARLFSLQAAAYVDGAEPEQPARHNGGPPARPAPGPEHVRGVPPGPRGF
jgi:ATP-binding cassette subfamily B protein